MLYFTTLQSQLDGVVLEAERRIAEKGQIEVEAVAPTTSVDGNRVGQVFIEDVGDMTRVVYAGEDVAYIEFGTGYVGANNPYPDQITLNNANWIYDVNEHGYAGWVYKLKDGSGYRHSRGMEAQAPILKGFKKTQVAVPQIVREVMNEKFGR